MSNQKTNKSDLIYPELSYKIVGILYKVYNKLGPGYQEKVYQNAIEVELKRLGIPHKREQYVSVTFEGEGVGKYFVDFVIDEKITLEIKQKEYFDKKFIHQVLDYLNGLHLKLAIIANFGERRLNYKRVVNPRVIIR